MISRESAIVCPALKNHLTGEIYSPAILDIDLLRMFAWSKFSWLNGENPVGTVRQQHRYTISKNGNPQIHPILDGAQCKCTLEHLLSKLGTDASSVDDDKRDSLQFNQDASAAAERLEVYVARGYAFQRPDTDDDDDSDDDSDE